MQTLMLSRSGWPKANSSLPNSSQPDLIRQQQVRFKGAGPIQNKEVCTVTSHSATSCQIVLGLDPENAE